MKTTFSSAKFFNTMLVVFALSYCVLLTSYRSNLIKPLSYHNSGQEDVGVAICPPARSAFYTIAGFVLPDSIRMPSSFLRTVTGFLYLPVDEPSVINLFHFLTTINAP